jgi:hypothetical protein
MINEIQALIYSRVDDAVTVDCYGYAPQDCAYPFVVVGPLLLNDNSDDNQKTAFIGEIAIYVYTSDKSTFNNAVIQKQIYDALHLVEGLATATYELSIIRQSNTRILTESDGITHQGIQSFDVVFEVPQAYNY